MVDRVDQLGERGITLKILGRVRAGEMVAVTGELRKRILAAMAANGIEIPAPVLPSGMPVTGSMMGGRVGRAEASDDRLDDDPSGGGETAGDQRSDG
jgi:hypothetical protein